MASSKEYLDYVLDQLSGLDNIRHRAMMGEFVIYYRDKVIGGVYDDRFLLKPTKSVMEVLSDAEYELPYEGAKEKKRGFKYVGPVTIYSHLQACGIINDHDADCSCYKKILAKYPTVRKRRDKEVR